MRDGVAEEGRAKLFQELVLLDIDFRRLKDEEPQLDEYTDRFLEFKALLVDIFHSAVPTIEFGDYPSTETANDGYQIERNQRSSASDSKLFGDYELLEEIARGGMGVVYKARQVSLNRTVALKMILAGELADEEQVRRFQVEAEAAAKLDHSGIVPVFEVGCHNGQHFLSMAFVEGESLQTKLRDGPLPPEETAKMMHSVAEVVEFAHQRGVVHRDLKPPNILLDSDAKPRITDFRLAKRIQEDSGLTATGQIMGTPAYMPPEQAIGSIDVGPLADVYSLGATLYHLLTGRPPFQAATKLETLQQVVDAEPASPRALNSSVPRDLETICLKCLEKDAVLRFQTAQDVADDLQRFLRNEPIKARPITRIERAWRWCRRNPVVSSLSAAILLVVLVASSAVVAQRWANQMAIAKSERNEIQTTVAAMSSARGILVPHVIKNLDKLPHQLVRNELQGQFETADLVEQLSLAYALAHFGDVRVDFLISQVEGASPDEVENLVAALSKSNTEAVSVLETTARNADSKSNWRHKARLAMLALHLNAPALAQEVCRLGPDPIQRTWFIEECSTWHGDLATLAELVTEFDQPLRSGVASAVGSVPIADVSAAEKEAWEAVLVFWYKSEPDSLTHSTADWALRKWKLKLPTTATSKSPIDGMNWHVNGVGITMVKIPAGSFDRRDIAAGAAAAEQTVKLTQSFLLADREVTRAQYQQFIDDPDYPAAEKPRDK